MFLNPFITSILDAAEAIDVIERFVKIFGHDCIEGVLADREFVTQALFSWCNEKKILFYIRIKDNAIARLPKSGGKGCRVKKRLGSINPN